jgi:GAF domain-containing protein
VIAMENARLFAELQERTADLTRSVERLTALFEIGQAVSGTLDLDRVLATVVARASDLAGAEAGTIYAFDADGGVFEPRASHGMNAGLIAAVTPQRVACRPSPSHRSASATI